MLPERLLKSVLVGDRRKEFLDMSRNSLFPKKKKRFVLKQVTHKKVDTLTLEDRQSLKEN